MMPPTTVGARAVVEIWERGLHEHTLDRALTILSVLEGQPRAELARISLERRDFLLLTWRARLFGPDLTALATCPVCACAVEVVLTPPVVPSPIDVSHPLPGTDVTVRMPSTLDLAAMLAAPTVEAARQLLLTRCLSAAEPPSAEVLAAAEAELEARAEISALAALLNCPDCEHQWTLELDAAAFLWREVDLLARRLLREVDLLARRYGWTEREVLGLSAARRHFYLELAS